MSTQQEKRIARFIEPVITDLGYDLVQIKIIGSKKLQTLQIMAENPATRTLDLEGCTKISRAVSAVLDVEDPFSSAYQLEVSSPGIDRPLVRPRDFESHTGFEASVETETPAENGQKKYRGKIISFSEGTLELDTDQGRISVPFDDITKARLVMNDDLIKATMAKKKTADVSLEEGDEIPEDEE